VCAHTSGEVDSFKTNQKLVPFNWLDFTLRLFSINRCSYLPSFTEVLTTFKVIAKKNHFAYFFCWHGVYAVKQPKSKLRIFLTRTKVSPSSFNNSSSTCGRVVHLISVLLITLTTWHLLAFATTTFRSLNWLYASKFSPCQPAKQKSSISAVKRWQ